MIRINFVKKEKREFKLPDFSRLKEINYKELLRDKGILVIPAIGLIIVAGELFYAKKLIDDVNALSFQVDQLTKERNKLKKKADKIQRQKRRLLAQIDEVKRRISYLKMSKDIILTLKDYYIPFNSSLRFLRTTAPNTVWFDNLNQRLEFERMNVELTFGSYDINSIKNFYHIVRREFNQLLPGEITKRENKKGIIFYVASMRVQKEFLKGEE